MHASMQKKLALDLLSAWLPFSMAEYEGSYFVLSAQGGPIVSERADPIMAPGVVPTNHVHEIYGADKFSATWNFESAQSSTCNNMGPKVDHSNYWFPALYFHDSDGFYTKVPSHLSVYYHFGTKDNGPRTMFPKGFKMKAGNAALRHDNSATEVSTKSIKWYCHGPEKISVGAFPEGVTECPGVFGLLGEIWLPFCWDGINEFDPSNPSKHVVYGGETQQGGKCPASHPKALPQLFMEFHHDIKDFANKTGADEPWVLAQGHPTGYGMHVDFINGWEDGPNSLEDAIAVDPNDPTKTKCFVGLSGEGAGACFELLSNDVMSSCNDAPVVQEDVVGNMKALPGCNPLQPGPEDATARTDCAGYGPGNTVGAFTNTTDIIENTPSVSAPETDQKDTFLASNPSTTIESPPESSMPSSTGSHNAGSPSGGNPASIRTSEGETWSYQGCYSDLTPDRTIRALGTWGRGKTSTECANHCIGAGFKISGTEHGSQCFCGNALKQSKKLDDSQCNAGCDGDGGETCGGNSALTVYAKEGTSLGLKRRSHKLRHAPYRAQSF